jgi:hypothetical protein
MKILAYAPLEDEFSFKLLHLLRGLNLGSDLEHFPTLLGLRSRLHRPLLRPASVLMRLPTSGDLAQAVTLRDLLDDVRTVLILPDRKASTGRLAQLLSPRYVHYPDQDPAFLAEALRRMASLPTAGWEKVTSPAA